MKTLKSKSDAGCTGVWAELLNIALDRPVTPLEDEPVPEQAVIRTAAPFHGPPPPPPPAYDYEIEPLAYFVGHGFCLLFSLGTLWALLANPITAGHVISAIAVWCLLGGCVFWLIQGVRFGCRVRVYKGYIELKMLCPTRIVTAQEVSHFKEFYRDSRTFRRFCLYLRSGERILLPHVHDSDTLRRCLVEVVGLEQAIM